MESKCDFNAQFILVCMKSIEEAEVKQIVQLIQYKQEDFCPIR